VVAGLIILAGRVFIAQRPHHKKHGGLWEFPGGKVEGNETLEAALYREIMEELGWMVKVGELAHRVIGPPEVSEVELHAFWCAIVGGDLSLNEHIRHCWALPQDLHQFPFTCPDQEIVTSLGLLLRFPDFGEGS
jgi:mutator protein MutT